MEGIEKRQVQVSPFPKPINPEEIRRLFEGRGFTTVADRSVSVDLYDILSPLLRILQVLQWWGSMGEFNKILPLEITGELRSLALLVHAADKDQQGCLVPIGSVQDVLNMPKAYVDSLRRYGKDPALRAQRLDDTDYTQLENENLDTIGETLLQLLALVLPASPALGDTK